MIYLSHMQFGLTCVFCHQFLAKRLDGQRLCYIYYTDLVVSIKGPNGPGFQCVYILIYLSRKLIKLTKTYKKKPRIDRYQKKLKFLCAESSFERLMLVTLTTCLYIKLPDLQSFSDFCISNQYTPPNLQNSQQMNSYLLAQTQAWCSLRGINFKQGRNL